MARNKAGSWCGHPTSKTKYSMGGSKIFHLWTPAAVNLLMALLVGNNINAKRIKLRNTTKKKKKQGKYEKMPPFSQLYWIPIPDV